MIYGIALIILGLLASPSILLSRKPNAQELLDKIVPYQGWIGLVFCFMGVFGIVGSVLSIGSVSIWWITHLATSVLEAALGFLLGYGMISSQLLAKNETARTKGIELRSKLAPIQGRLGSMAVGLGIWSIIASFL